MMIKEIPQRLAWSMLVLAVFVTPLAAQTRKPAGTPARTATKAAATEPAPTFDALLASGTYGVYGEVRGVGQLIRSQGISSLLDPVMKLAAPPKEFQTLVRWLNVNADSLMTSRMMCASWAHRPKLPQFLCAIEFPSAEEAQKFEPRLRTFLPKLLPTPTPEKKESNSAKVTDQPKVVTPEQTGTPAAPPLPYVITHAGSLVLISPTAFKFNDLRPANSKLLAEDQDFRTTRDRFATDPVFVYFDVKTMMKEAEERRRKQQEQFEQERKKVEAEAARRKQTKPEKPEPTTRNADEHFEVTENSATLSTLTTEESTVSETTTELRQTPAETLAFASLSRAFMGGQSKWPDAIGAAISFDNDSYNLRVLLIHPADDQGVILPFLPQLVSGPPLTPAASSVLPADTDVFVTLSLDYSSIHERMVKAFTEQPELAFREAGQIRHDETASSLEPQSPFAAYEKLLGIKLKEELIPLLGNEIALSLRGLNKATEEITGTAASENSATENKEDATKAAAKTSRGPIPLVAIALKDREAVKKLLPRIIESIGLKGAGLLAQTERRENTELVSYANVFAYAFIGDFLVVSTESDAVRQAVDSYLKNETLGSDSKYRNFTRWQPRQVLGQVYMPSGTMDSYGISPRTEVLSEQVQEFVSSLGPVTEPVTYSLSNEGAGPLHELHVPRNVMLLMVAGFTGASQQSSLQGNQIIAQSMLRGIAGAQETYKSTHGKGSFGTLEQLVEAKLISVTLMHGRGYRIDLSVSGANYEATAVPLEYGKTGRMSYFIDATSILRGGDHGGGPATIADQPLQ